VRHALALMPRPEIEIETARSNRAGPRWTGPAFALLNVRRIRDSNS